MAWSGQRDARRRHRQSRKPAGAYCSRKGRDNADKDAGEIDAGVPPENHPIRAEHACWPLASARADRAVLLLAQRLHDRTTSVRRATGGIRERLPGDGTRRGRGDGAKQAMLLASLFRRQRTANSWLLPGQLAKTRCWRGGEPARVSSCAAYSVNAN